MVVVVSSFPRRQQYRRLRRAGEYAAASAVAGGLTVLAVALDAIPIAAVLLLATAGLAVRARHWARLAGRSRVGARSESEVRRALAPLEAEGWRLRHSLSWAGRGDVDSVAIAPTGIGVAFAIETKTPVSALATRRNTVIPQLCMPLWTRGLLPLSITLPLGDSLDPVEIVAVKVYLPVDRGLFGLAPCLDDHHRVSIAWLDSVTDPHYEP